jgi:hypothetical protein
MPRHSYWGGVALVVLLLIAGAAAALYENRSRIPPNWLPWRPVVLDAEPSWLAHFQLNALSVDRDACRSALQRSRLVFTPMADRRIDDECGFSNVVRSDRPPVAFNGRLVATCGLTAALYWYERILEGFARSDLDTTLTRIDQLGTYACRNVNSEANGPRSEHATANAIDIAAFHFADGRTISVGHDYGKPTPAGRFLDHAHDAACTLFNAVLGPRYNRLHATHFHLDMGPYRICS